MFAGVGWGSAGKRTGEALGMGAGSMGFCMREDNGTGRVRVCGGRDGLAGMREGPREEGGFRVRGGRDGLAPPAFAGAGYRRDDTELVWYEVHEGWDGGAPGLGRGEALKKGGGMGPRMREDNGTRCGFGFAGGGMGNGEVRVREGRLFAGITGGEG